MCDSLTMFKPLSLHETQDLKTESYFVEAVETGSIEDFIAELEKDPSILNWKDVVRSRSLLKNRMSKNFLCCFVNTSRRVRHS